MVTPARLEKIKYVASNRQKDLTVILENVHDIHNIGAIMRTCDSIGIHEIYVIYSIESSKTMKDYMMHKSSSGSKKWVTVHYYDSVESCFDAVRKNYHKIYGTHIGEDSSSLYELDLAEPVALLFGNEHRGISEDALSRIDGNFLIPQVGMVQSLNISVACAVSLYEAMRQRLSKGYYMGVYNPDNAFQKSMVELYIERTKKR